MFLKNAMCSNTNPLKDFLDLRRHFIVVYLSSKDTRFQYKYIKTLLQVELHGRFNLECQNK
jgi:hypothetical protein